jgi:hypothetical protein
MSKATSKPKSRKEHDQIKRDRMNNKKPASNNESIIEKCKKLIKGKNIKS